MSEPSRCLIAMSTAAAVLMGLAGCQRAPEEKKVAAPAPAPWTLDESKLQQPIRFAATDLDPSQSACKDLSAYVNGKWLAANAIPADESGWGAFLVLRNRSLGVRQQLAERIAAEPNATGIDKIIGENPLFTFGPQPDFKDSTQNIGAAFQGGLGLPDSTYYSLADKKPIRDAYEKHIAKLLELSGIAPADAAKQDTTVLA